MDFVDFLEKVCNVKLFEYQKQFLRAYDKAHKEGKRLILEPTRGRLKGQGGEKKECEIDTSIG